MALPYAIIAYGYNLGDGRRLGPTWAASADHLYASVEDRLAERDTSLSELGVRLEEHGFADQPHWLLATAVHTASPEDPLDLGFLGKQEPRPDWDQALAQTLSLLDLRAVEPATWRAYSLLG